MNKTLRRCVLGVRDFVSDMMRHVDPRFHYKPRIRWWHNRSWMEPYMSILQLDGRQGTRILDRRFTLLEAARSVRQLSGSTVECGVAKGVGSALICKELADTYQNGEVHFAFDSFEGVSEPQEKDRMANGKHHWHKGKLRRDVAVTTEFLQQFPDCEIVQGWIPDSLASATDHQFRLVHIDVDLYEPTRDSLEFFWPRLCSRGVVLLDDHGFIDCPGARSATLEYFEDKPEPVIEFATGQAMIVKI